MNSNANRVLKVAAVAVAVGAPAMSHAAVALGRGYGVAAGLAGVQALAVGFVIWGAAPRWRWAAPAVSGVLLAGLAAGWFRSAQTGLLVAAGLSHAMLYTALLAVFSATLQPGRTSLITHVARRLNPTFHAGMIPYTRAVTAAWCLFFAGQILLSAVLLAVASGWWAAFVTTLHVPLVLAMGLAEFLVRRWRWRHEHYTSLKDTILGVRRLRAEAAAAQTSRPAAGCPGHSGNATPRPALLADSGPAQEG